MILDTAQSEAVGRISRWFHDPAGPQIFRLFGYAGTGKTTLARYIAESVPGHVLYAAYSGKAASVLRSKGCVGASTIHSLIYLPKQKSRDKIEHLKRELLRNPDDDELLTLLHYAEVEYARPEFVLNDDSQLRGARLLILDEVSMVNAAMARDLESFGVRILCLGDPAQLPPIEGGGHYTEATPDFLLTQVHRSAAESPVTRLATAARLSDDAGHGVTEMDGDSGRWSGGKLSLKSFDQVLVGTNKTRWNIISRMRSGLGSAPVAGDRIITLSNNADADVFNGEQFTILSVGREVRDGLVLAVRTDSGVERELAVRTSGFVDLEGEKLAKRHGRRGPAAATFAQAVTVHKAQGSQWGRVLVLDESEVFAWMRRKELISEGATRREAEIGGHEQSRRWFYTALTRASEQVVVKDLAGR